jgi:hypothetical protein
MLANKPLKIAAQYPNALPLDSSRKSIFSARASSCTHGWKQSVKTKTKLIIL